MVKAVWKDTILAESDNYAVVEGVFYFPPESVNKEFLRECDAHSTCPLKGRASYYDIVVDGDVKKEAAYCYHDPNPGSGKIKNYVAFCKGVEFRK